MSSTKLPRIRAFLAAGILVAVFACGLAASTIQRAALPTHGQPRIGVLYAATFVCPLSVQIGDAWWAFSPGTKWPQPVLNGGIRYEPYEVPGILIFTSPDRAVFLADADGSRLELERLAGPGWPTSAACI
jgi:hypothetical protein